MAVSREILHEQLCDILGTRNCYFRPPTGLEMKYPCIRYDEVNSDLTFADNKIYRFMKQYELIVIDSNPNSTIPKKLIDAFSYLRPGREYYGEGLKHFPFTLYF